MALTDAQKVQIRKWMGWSRAFDQNSRLESRMSAAYLSADEETEVIALLARLVNCTTARTELVTDGMHGIKRVDEIEFQDTSQGFTIADGYNAEVRAIISELESVLGVTKKFDVTSGSGRGGGMGGAFRLG